MTHAAPTDAAASDAPLEERPVRDVVHEVASLILSAPAARLEAEASLAAFIHSVEPPEQARHAAELRRIDDARAKFEQELVARMDAVLAQARQKHDKNAARVDLEERKTLNIAESQLESEIDAVRKAADEKSWTADAIFEEQQPAIAREHAERIKAVDERCAAAMEFFARARGLLGRAGVGVAAAEPGALPPTAGDADPTMHLDAAATAAEDAFRMVRQQTPALLLRNKLAQVGLLVAVLLAAVAVVQSTVGWADMTGPAVVAGALAASAAAQAAAFAFAGRRLRAVAAMVAEGEQRLKSLRTAVNQWSIHRRDQRALQSKTSHDLEVAQVREKLEERVNALQGQLPQRLDRVHAAAADLRARNDGNLDGARRSAEQARDAARAQLEERLGGLRAAEAQRHAARLAELAVVTETRRTQLRTHWHEAQRCLGRDFKWLAALELSRFLPWSDPSWDSFDGCAQPGDAISLGHVSVALHAIQGALPLAPELAWPTGSPRVVHLPVTLSLPSQGSLLMETDLEGREAGRSILQESMLRVLTTLPPGKARFTIFDPVGLGETFAAFMHLSEDAEHIVGERIWTDPRQMEHRLTDLCDHMETVIQKFLRNEYADLAAYNRQAGEIAEPYRFLVMSDFPVGLTEVALRRLTSIVTSGPRCGVFTLLLHDTRHPVPAEFDLREVRQRSLNLTWRGDRFAVTGTPLEAFPFHAGIPPADERATALLKRLAAAAKRAKRVEVPFSVIAPQPAARWKERTDESIAVPLGRSGATRLQHLTLGIGTSQHALVAGKTGSGKSTLLHALVTNIALRFSPDQAEVWLIDFKKGVEFRTYATHALPHARVVAVESDREFGLSVLRGLDAELRRRGDLYRESGVQDLAAFRRARPSERMPRSLLIIDEFQELFTEDDKVSEESGLLLDRLVRQGRAFGIHVVLGSQTLGGAYSIARATMGQMGVRIALQCTEADSQLILADDNVAARLLSRPGEAIYNDAGGLVEGNNPFQVVWLADAERDRLLAEVRTLDRVNPCHPRPQMLVFEGSAPALLEQNAPLRSALAHRGTATQLAPRLWLGDAVAIEDPTSVPMRRCSGSNLVVVGQRDDAAAGVLGACIVSIAAQCGRAARVLLVDGTPQDDPDCDRLAILRSTLGIPGAAGSHNELDGLMREAAGEVRRRITSGESKLDPWVVAIQGLHRFRALRRAEDSFGFSSDAPAETPDRLLGEVLRDGPGVGIHVVVTVDSITSLMRAIDRNALREFGWRALFQLSATDSSTLIDSPAASRLGPQRALLHNEDSGTQQKFRPYSFPAGPLLESASVSGGGSR